ncbi:MAG: penicillin-binding protein activator [Steroidobacteraceae bacterium]
MQHSIPFKFARAAAACVLAAMLAACASTSTPGSGPASVNRAERLLQQGNPAGAAQMYERLAQDNPPPDRNDFTLAAARAWLTANRADDAQRVMEGASGEFPAAQQFERELLVAEIAMARGQYAPAWKQIAAVAEPRKPGDAARLFLLQQQVALRAGQPLEGVRAGIARERVAATDNDRSRARRDLLADLRAAIDRGLRIDPAAARDALVRGWLEIGQIAASAGRSPLSAAPAIERWRSRFPGHPAATIATSEIIAPGERPAARGAAGAVANNSPIGLLLPLTGRQTAATAALIRDGFLAAVARLPEGTRPPVRVYDTDALTVATAMQNARADGAGFLVGPLTRAEVQTAAEQRPGDLPLLLLNSLDGSGYVGAQLYQYALAPEDEARQIARQMFGAGQRRALVVAPSGEWGTRVAAAFTDELTRAGGQVVAQGSYDLARNDITTALTSLLGIDESRARYRRVQQITSSELVFEAHPRPDIDAVFAAGYQSLALRQINPQLRFFNAGDLPVYITQQGLDTDAQANRDLEGMRVLDMPWMLESVGPAADLRTATESAWSARGLTQSRYFAFGYDAATLAIAIRNGSNTWPLPGLTGRLNLNTDGRIERSLNWARMRDGSAQPFDPVAQ